MGQSLVFGLMLCRDIWMKSNFPIYSKVGKHSSKVHIWGAISTRGASVVKIFTQNFNSEVNINTFNEYLLEVANFFHPDGWILQEDNSPIHRHHSSQSREWKSSRNILVLDWLSNSPDLNPIENLWAVLKIRLLKKYISIKEELCDKIVQEWESYTSFFLQNFIFSMENRLRMCIRVKGEKINY